MSDFVEKRRYPRNTVKYTGEISLGDNEIITAEIENVSKTGLLLSASEKLTSDQPIHITIKKENSPLDPISAIGEVVWEEADKNSRTAGIHFSKIRWSETDRLINNLRY